MQFFSLLKVNKSLFLIFIGLLYVPFGFALIPPPLQLLSLIRNFWINLGHHPGGIKVPLGPPSLFSFLSFGMKLIVKSSLRRVLTCFSHHEFPWSSWKSTWEESKWPLGPPLSNKRVSLGITHNPSSDQIHLGYPQSWLAISCKNPLRLPPIVVGNQP
jgi:hypothetical protein